VKASFEFTCLFADFYVVKLVFVFWLVFGVEVFCVYCWFCCVMLKRG